MIRFASPLSLSLRLGLLSALSVTALCACDKSSTGSSANQTSKASLPPGPTTGTATITGRVKFVGTPPERPEIRVGADNHCVAAHKDKPLLREDVVVNPNGTLRDVVIRVKSGLPEANWSAMVTTAPAKLDQNGCQYVPHVLSMTVGQTLEIHNSDATIHNINGRPANNDVFNFSMVSDKVPARSVVFANSEWPPAVIKCDVHPWMRAHLAVLDHPFHATTGEGGTYVLSRLPAGTYVIEAFHQELGSKEATVTVAQGGSVTQEFEFTGAAK